MNVSEHTLKSFGWWNREPWKRRVTMIAEMYQQVAPLSPLRVWLNNVEVNHPQLAHRLCKLIPAQCPFARNVSFFGRTVFSIPPLCKLNPLYNELMMLRFRAICYLAEECGEDISNYC
ncbi:MAG: Mo-dependent nitrogenase C-terminal domain-containing protein [Cyanophyceae cyanobacterium]